MQQFKHLPADPDVPSDQPKTSGLPRVFRFIACCGMRFTIAFAAIILVGLIPVNNDFQPVTGGIEIFVASNAVHAEIVVPIESNVIDWREHLSATCFPTDTSAATHVALGWGDRGFFLKTPTWAEFRVSVAANALLLPSETCIHATMKSTVRPSDNVKAIRVSEEQYGELVAYLMNAFQRGPDGRVIHVPEEHYGQNDAFFDAHGTYHFLNTCNSWAGRALQATGVRVGWMTPLPKTVFWYLPSSEEF